MCQISDDPGWEPKCGRPATKYVKLTDHRGYTKIVWMCEQHYVDQRTQDGFREIWERVEY